jgi:hypothetical protein
MIYAVKSLPSTFNVCLEKKRDDVNFIENSDSSSELCGATTIPVSVKIRLCEKTRETAKDMGMLSVGHEKLRNVDKREQRQQIWKELKSHEKNDCNKERENVKEMVCVEDDSDDYNGADMYQTLELVKIIRDAGAGLCFSLFYVKIIVRVHHCSRTNPYKPEFYTCFSFCN